MKVTTCTIGYPRIGAARQMKSALERHWKGQSTLEELLAAARTVQEAAWTEQHNAGVQLVGADGTLYDHVLDTTFWLGVVPKRFEGLTGHELYFALARGAQALDMSKHFDSNYHHMVPELEAGWRPKPDYSQVLDKLTRCQAAIGKQSAVPIIVGPITWCCLAKRGDQSVSDVVSRLLPAYVELLKQIKQLQAPEVQLHEPWLTTSHGATLSQETQAAYQQLAAVGLPINLVTSYDDLGAAYPWVITLPVAAVSMDFVGVSGAAAPNQSLDLVRKFGFPKDKRLGAGVVDGRSVWADTGLAGAIVGELLSLGVTHLSVQSSVSLQHLPLDVEAELQLPGELRQRLGFAKQKLGELVAVAQQAQQGKTGASNLASFKPSELPFDIEASRFQRPQPYSARRDLQPQFPAFPTTTIGSFPQTEEVRRLRLHFKQGRITQAAYEAGIASHIGYAVGVQEALGLDVLVHGEAERTDMVEFFGQELEGMAFTQHGWVQSYGSRYVRPPLIVSDVKFVKPMTTHEFQVAQGLTRRPMKGMLTGPVTILNWSFPRRDITRKAQAFQLALALREEVAALEKVGCIVVQVDEPALREGLPLKSERWADYLQWAVEAFRLTTAVAAPATQVVTHLCYSDFQDIMQAIIDMDADVLTIENSRSGDDMVRALAAVNYPRDLGAGIYDVHSPATPSVEFIKGKLRSFVATGLLGGRCDRLWVNPDCGLKTRTWNETIPAIRNMVQAATELRAELAAGGVAAVAAAAPAGTDVVKAGGGNSCVAGSCCH